MTIRLKAGDETQLRTSLQGVYQVVRVHITPRPGAVSFRGEDDRLHRFGKVKSVHRDGLQIFPEVILSGCGVSGEGR